MGNNSNDKEYIFTTTDPFGKEIRLKSSTWNFHITGGDHERTELFGEEETIKEVISDPKFILRNDPENPDDTRQKYIDLVDLNAFDSLKGLVVVVDHQNPEYGDIVTIMPKSRINESTKGGTIYVRGKSTNK
jgi:hypothetical protein